MKRLLAQHRFSNGARLKVSCVKDEPNVPKEDYVCLEFRSGNGDEFGAHMRPDEAVLVIAKLASALYQMVSAYRIAIPKRRRAQSG